MINKYMIARTSDFLNDCISIKVSEGELSTKALNRYFISLFKKLDSDNIESELKPIYDAFEILKLAEQYFKNHPTITDWVIKPDDLDSYWDWEQCVRYARNEFYEKKYMRDVETAC